MASDWSRKNIPALHDRLALVTGANRGLGLEIAAGLAAAGATVVLGCRDAGKAHGAVEALLQRVPGAKLEVLEVDLASLASIHRAADNFSGRFGALHLLVNNASAIMVPESRTIDGFEMHFGTNHLGTFALTGLLLPQLQAAPAARIVNTASLAHRLTPGLDLDDPHFERRPYKEMDAYGASKLATLLFTFELDRRLRASHATTLAVAAHPGYTATNPDIGSFWMRLSTRLFAQPTAVGALPALYAATAADVAGGDYYGPGGFKELKGPPTKVACRPEARDAQLGQRLWSLSEALTGVRYAIAG